MDLAGHHGRSRRYDHGECAEVPISDRVYTLEQKKLGDTVKQEGITKRIFKNLSEEILISVMRKRHIATLDELCRISNDSGMADLRDTYLSITSAYVERNKDILRILEERDGEVPGHIAYDFIDYARTFKQYVIDTDNVLNSVMAALRTNAGI